MPEMPIEQDYGRFVDPMSDEQAIDEGLTFDIPEDEAELEELPDGSVRVTMENGKGPMEDKDFYQNLAEVIDPTELDSLAMRYLELLAKDKTSREERDKQYEEGLKRTGMGKDAPGGANFMGASKVVHPAMAEACVDFASRAIKEMFPPDGPVRTKILGKVDQDKTERAERKRDWMNWQLTEQIEEFRDEQEQLLTQLPLGGSQYMKLWYDEKKKRPCAEFLPIDKVLIPFSATNFYTAQRAAEIHDITAWEFKQRIASGLYRDISLIRASLEPEETKAEKANNKIEGRKWEENVDGERRVFHIYTWLELDDDTESRGEMAPYILMVDELESEVVGLYRNWEEGDETMTKLDWVVEFKFVPWRGAYAIGLPHLIGGLSAALTGALRALLDSAHINNAPALLKLKGAKVSGQSQQVDITQVVEIEAAPGVDDIKKIAMAMPFNPPSAVLFELLGWLDKAAKGVITTAEEKIADVTAQAPVGTTQALIEQGAAVFSAIHARLHESQGRVLKILGRLNRWYLSDMRKGEIVVDLKVEEQDFQRNTDVVPVSDPHIFSETQRMAQIQAVLARADKAPDLYDRRAVEERLLKQLKIPSYNELLKNTPSPNELSAVDENVAMALGQNGYAYIHQDHLAHIQAHLDFALNPAFGGNPIMASIFLPRALEHIKQHMILWYLNRSQGYVSKLRNGKFVTEEEYENQRMTAEIDKVYAVVSQHVKQDSEKAFGQILPLVQQLLEAMKQMTPQPQLPPEAQVLKETSLAETQRRAQRDQAEMQLKGADMQQKGQLNMARMQADMQRAEARDQLDVALNATNNLTKERIETARLTQKDEQLQAEQFETAIRLQNEAQRTLGVNRGPIQ
jgi:chaperonin GroES